MEGLQQSRRSGSLGETTYPTAPPEETGLQRRETKSDSGHYSCCTLRRSSALRFLIADLYDSEMVNPHVQVFSGKFNSSCGFKVKHVLRQTHRSALRKVKRIAPGDTEVEQISLAGGGA